LRILGYLGVKPVKPGYEEYAVTPVLGGLKWMKGSVPVPGGEITVYMDRKTIRLKADRGKGYLYVSARKQPRASVGEFQKISEGKYRLWIDSNEEITVRY
jgi:alpha-L-rhamnosidase